MRIWTLGVSLVRLGLGCSVSQNDDNADFDAICDVHNVPLLTGEAEVYYGYPDFGAMKDRKERFPHANSNLWGGGCIVNEARPKASVSYCPECRKAEALSDREEMQKDESKRIPIEMIGIQDMRLFESRKACYKPKPASSIRHTKAVDPVDHGP